VAEAEAVASQRRLAAAAAVPAAVPAVVPAVVSAVVSAVQLAQLVDTGIVDHPEATARASLVAAAVAAAEEEPAPALVVQFQRVTRESTRASPCGVWLQV
jgi:hypothetical protein